MKIITFTKISEGASLLFRSAFMLVLVNCILVGPLLAKGVNAPAIGEEILNVELLDTKQVDKTIKGTVTNSSGEGIPGANVLVEGTSVGAVTDADGKFTLDVPDGSDVLLISFIGYNTERITIGSQTTFDIILIEDLQSLEEIVVIGYGTQKKSDLTGALSSIDSDVIRQVPTATVGQALQGLAPGVTITGRSGTPGSESTIRIRGFGTINNSNPYIIVDGVPGSLNNLNPGDIESIEILKDASATAIYGSNGANGVVLVTTKRGKEGKITVNVDSYVGAQKAWRGLDVLSGPEWAMLHNEGNRNDGNPEQFANPESLPTFAWGELVYRTGVIQNHQVSVSGGNEFADYFVSYGYTDQEGIIRNSDFNRHNLRVNNSYKIHKNVKFGHLISYNRSVQNRVNEASRWLWDHTAVQGYGWEPYLPFYQPDGSFTQPIGVNATHPEAELLFEDQGDMNRGIGANIFLEAKILQNFTFKTTYALGFGLRERFDFDEALGNDFGENGGILRPQNSINQLSNRSSSYTWNNVLTYANSFNDVHNLTVLIGHEQQETEFVSTNATGRNISPLFVFPVVSSTAEVEAAGGRSETQLLSYFTRVAYNYNDRYLFTGTVRRDASSVFGENSRWGTFPAAAFAWNAHNEAFMEGSSVLSRLKIRAGWGEIGNRNLGNFQFAPKFRLGPRAGVDVVFGDARASGAAIRGVANPDLQWESTVTTNFGVDLGFMEDKITLSIDYFNRNTTDMLINIAPPTQTSGLTDRTQFNIGEMNNKGIEIALGYKGKIGPVNISVDGNIDFISNELTKLDTENAVILNGDAFGQMGFLRSEPGQPLSQFFGLRTDGLFQTQEEVDNSSQPDANPGDIRFVDIDNNGVIDDDDRTFIGSPFPDFNYSVNINADYNNFDLRIFFQGVQGNEIFSSMPWFFENELGSGLVRSALDRWTGPGTSNTVPRATFEGAAANNVVSDRYVYDGSYLRLKNVVLGYTLPKTFLDKYGIQKVRVYASSQNLLTFTKYDIGLDPEIGQSANQGQLYIGQDRGNYPQPRVFTFGVNLTF